MEKKEIWINSEKDIEFVLFSFSWNSLFFYLINFIIIDWLSFN